MILGITWAREEIVGVERKEVLNTFYNAKK